MCILKNVLAFLMNLLKIVTKKFQRIFTVSSTKENLFYASKEPLATISDSK